MADVVLQLWEFRKAPANLRDMFPGKFAGEWLVLVRPDDQAADFVSDLIVHWNSRGLLMTQGQAADGAVVLAGAYAAPCAQPS